MKKLFFILICIYNRLLICTQLGIISVPVADLFGQPLVNNKLIDYKTVPECGVTIGDSCSRLHQALYNEVVTILETRNNEIKINIHNCFYTTTDSKIKHHTYWTYKNNVIPFSILQKNNIEIIKTIPAPINFQDKKNRALHDTHIVTITMPYYNKKLNMHFSVGTRFVLTNKQNNRSSYWHVHAYNPTKEKIETITLPKQKCVRQTSNMALIKRKKNFVNILNQWTQHTSQWIPYVWGGCSFVATVNKPFEQKKIKRHGTSHNFFTYNTNKTIKTGFDCAGLILRAAQLSGIPYFYKNTTTIALHLSNVTNTILSGDIIWVPGHVMVVTDNNMLFEARGYHHEYGKAQKLKLHTVFKSVNNYELFFEKYKTKEPMVRIDKNGKERNVFKKYMILRI